VREINAGKLEAADRSTLRALIVANDRSRHSTVSTK
jgi:hypothetical protein